MPVVVVAERKAVKAGAGKGDKAGGKEAVAKAAAPEAGGKVKKPPVSPAKAPSKPAIQAPVKQKKSMSSRREELLQQLKAVEDAIQRKRAKMQ